MREFVLSRRAMLRAAGLLGVLPAGGFAQSGAPTVHERIQQATMDAPLSMRFRGKTEAEAREWQRRFGEKLRSLLGPFDPPAKWETETEKDVELPDHRREHLVLHAEGHPPLPVYRLTPLKETGGKRAGIVAVHGHGPFGYDPVAGIATTPEQVKSSESANYDYGLQLVRRGYVVTVPCLTPFGRRLDDPEAYSGGDPCGVTYVRLQLLGKVLIAENLRDVLWSLALLRKTPVVDGDRVGCVGLSYGGRMTMLAAAVERSFRVAVVAGALNVMQERISARYSCGAQVIPGLLEYGDVPEIGALIAPRPCLWTVGNQDALMVKDWIEPALARMRPVYDAFGAGENLMVEHFEGGHRWSAAEAYPLLDRVLQA